MRSNSLQFGPWTTTLHHGSRLELSAFWRRRLDRLGAVAAERSKMHWCSALGVGILAAALLLVPQLRMERAAAEEQSPPSTAAVAARDEPFTAVFSNGVKVQLIGLSINPSKGQPWWGPDGKPLDEAPYARVPAVMRTIARQLPREICWRWINLPDDPDVETNWMTDPHYCGAGGGRAFDAEGKKVPGVTAWAVCIPDAPDTCTLRFSVSIGATPWSTAFTSDGHQKAIARTQDGVRQGAIFAVPTAVEAGTSITVSHQIPGQAVRLVAIDRTNRLHPASSETGGGAMGFEQKTYRFADLAPDSIQRYELQSQSRQFDTIEFRNVSLHPDKQTKIEIVRIAASDGRQTRGTGGLDEAASQSAASDLSGKRASDGEPSATTDATRHAEERYRRRVRLLQTLTEEYGYRLPGSQPLTRVAPPFVAPRNEIAASLGGSMSLSHDPDAGTKDEVQAVESIRYQWLNGDLYAQTWDYASPTLRRVLDSAFELKLQDLQLDDAKILDVEVPGDWVMNWDPRVDHVTNSREIAVLERVLREELELPVRLELRRIERPVYLVRGSYQFTPIAGPEGKIHRVSDAVADKADGMLQIPARRTDVTYSVGSYQRFLHVIGEVILTPMVDEAERPPAKESLFWHYYGERPQNLLDPLDEQQVDKVLDSVTQQTGLTFTKETRPVTTLVITRDDAP